jgi:hypothetical protein
MQEGVAGVSGEEILFVLKKTNSRNKRKCLQRRIK